MRTLYISGYPFVASSDWMDSLINFNHDIDISYHLHEVDARSALPKLNRKITELESTRRAMMRDGKIVGSEIIDPLESAINLRDKIQRGQEKLFQMAIYVCLRAENKEELDRVTRILEANLSARLFYSKVARYQQLEALQSILPRGEDQLAQKRKLGQLKLCEKLEKYISGSLADVFNTQTNVKLDNRLVIFDIKDLPENIRQIMMLIISNFVKNQVMAKPEKRLLVIDEGWILLQHEESARFVAGLVRRARKYYLGVSIISQQANDFLKNEYGRAIASQSALRILMRQDTTTIKGVVSEFNLSEYEQSFLLTCERGDALLIADQNHVAVKVVAAEEEHPLITTNPAELYNP